MLFVTFNDLSSFGVWKGLSGLIGLRASGREASSFRQQSGFLYSKVNKRVTATNNSNFNQRLTIALLTGTMLAGIATPAFAQSAAAPPVAQAPALAPPAAPQMQSLCAITVSGAPRPQPGGSDERGGGEEWGR